MKHVWPFVSSAHASTASATASLYFLSGTAHELMKLPRRYRGHYVIYVNNAQFDSCVWDYTESCREWYDLIRTRHDFL